MRTVRTFLLATALVLTAGAAHAATVSFTGQLSIRIATLPSATVYSDGVAFVNGSGGLGHLTALAVPDGVFFGSHVVLPVTDPGASPIKGVQLTVANAAGGFGRNDPGRLVGRMPLRGFARACLFGPCSGAVANISVPLSVVGREAIATAAGPVNLTVIGSPWTTGTVAIDTITMRGAAYPASNTANLSGVLSLVTPVFVSTNIAAIGVVPTFVFATLHFVPEPTTLALLGAGVSGLVAMRRSRRRA